MSNLSGRLSLVTFEAPASVEVWVMNKYGISGSWTKQFSVDFSRRPLPPSVQTGAHSWPRGLFDSVNLLLHCKSDLCLYGVKSNGVESVCPHKSSIWESTTYVDSLFLS
ncbi:hypothetical protein TorRG33x02_311930 [Trema orientale]|uniref:F-box associated domain n=1 Tax=Trema orientale TaxID=63057 RepID=A0A2P5BQU2_TREOI|nr:hypothetical protein TorRG33x02_311930 [Trema orientale]